MEKTDACPRVDVVLFDDRAELDAWAADCGWCRVDQLDEAYEAYRRAGALDKACYRELWKEHISQERFFCETRRKAMKQAIAAAENTLRGIRTEYGEDFYMEWIWIDRYCKRPLLLAATMEDLYTSYGLRSCDGTSPSVLHYNGLCMRGCDNTLRLMKLHPAYTRYVFENPRLLLPALEAAKKGRRRGFAARARTDCRVFLAPFAGARTARSYPDPHQIDCAKSIPIFQNRGYGIAGGAIRIGRRRTFINRMHHGAMDEWYYHRFVTLRLGKDGRGEFSNARGGWGFSSEIQFDNALNGRRKGETIWMLIVECPPERKWEADALQFVLKSGHFTSRKVQCQLPFSDKTLPHRDVNCTTHCYCIKNDVDARTVELTEGWEALETFRAALDKIERVGEKESWEREWSEPELSTQICLRTN